jgi:hypothetical protein
MAMRASRIGLFALVATIIALFVANLMYVSHISATRKHGTLEASGTDLSTWTFTPDSCQSGNQRGFFGVSLFTSTDKRLGVAVINDPRQGYVVATNIPDTNRTMSFESCSVLRGDVHWSGIIINGVRGVSGSIELSCNTERASLSGRLDFDSCH